jgi:quinol monooxygenase YgiN
VETASNHVIRGAKHYRCRSCSTATRAHLVDRARRRARRCFAITADLIDPGRVNIFERWESQAAVEAFRRGGPSTNQGAAMLSASVAENDIADVRPLFGKGRA